MNSEPLNPQNPNPLADRVKRSPGGLWGLALLPLILLGLLLAYMVVTGGGLRELTGPPVEKLTLGRVTLPDLQTIVLEVINDGPETVKLAQVTVDDAFWSFTASPDSTLERFETTTVRIPYHWVEGEAHAVALMTGSGTVFVKDIPVAVQTPAFSAELLWRFLLIGLYVGVVPIVLGMLWYPWMRRLSKAAMNFILSLTVGLLAYLAVGTWLDALEFTVGLPAFVQGIPVVALVALISLGGLLALGNRRNASSTPLGLSRKIALGIGLHNLGEGLAIGAAFASGEAALGTFLVLGFTLHNITEGVGIAAPVVDQNPGLAQFALLALMAGGPAIVGTWLGGFAFNPTLAALFLAVGVGAILQVIWEVGRLVARDSLKRGGSLLNAVNLSGFTVGVAVMYFTAFLVKF